MKKLPFYLVLVLSLLVISCQDAKTRSTSSNEQVAQGQKDFAIAMHGGAGVMKPGQMSDSLENAYKDKLEEAISTGHKLLKEGKPAEDAVKASINVLENSPLFNAGKGAVLTNAETAEMDAALMTGKNLNAGAIAGVKHIKHPINLAKRVKDSSKHVMLYGDGAETFALKQDFDTLPQSYFITKRRLKEVKKAKAEEEKTAGTYYDSNIKDEKMGTVGAVALDKDGNLAAGTSTGGMTNKKFGRIGDSPIIGAGTYANNKTCAVSGTGWGEYYIRGVVAYDISALMDYKGLSLKEATHKVIQEKQPELGGDGGVIAMDHYGNASLEFNTPGMFRAKMDDKGNLDIGIYEKDDDE